MGEGSGSLPLGVALSGAFRRSCGESVREGEGPPGRACLTRQPDFVPQRMP